MEKCKWEETCGYDVCSYDYCPEFEAATMTNADHIRAMSDQEMAKKICGGAKYSESACSFCGKNNGEFCNGEWCRDKTDEEIILEWLQKPLEEA